MLKKGSWLQSTINENSKISQMSTRRGSTDVHEFDGVFLGHCAQYKVTSVIGHVFRYFVLLHLTILFFAVFFLMVYLFNASFFHHYEASFHRCESGLGPGRHEQGKT